MKVSRLMAWVTVLLLATHGIKAQSDSDSIRSVKVLGAKVHQGVVLIHSREIRSIRDSYPTGVEVDLAWHKVSEKSWESCLCYPKMGVSLSVWDYDNPEVLGQGVIGLFYIEPVFGASDKVSFSIRAATGLSYQNRPFDPVSNPLNLSYSTYLAFPLQLGVSGHFRLGKRTLINLSAFYNHFSNGGIREPNKGINWPTLALGVEYYLQEYSFKVRPKTNWRSLHPPKKRLDVTLLFGLEEPEKQLFIISPGVEVKYSKQFARINAYTFGAEYLFDNGARFIREKEQRDYESPSKLSLAAGHEFLLGKFIFSQQFGVYLYDPLQQYADVYQRYGLVYIIADRATVGINLKAHGHVANFIDVRAGIVF